MNRNSVFTALLTILNLATIAKPSLYWGTDTIELEVGEQKSVAIDCDNGYQDDYQLEIGTYHTGVEIINVTKTYLTGSRAEDPEDEGNGWWTLTAAYGTETLWRVGTHWNVTIEGFSAGTYYLYLDGDEGSYDTLTITVIRGVTWSISGYIEDSSGSGIYDVYVSANNGGGSDSTDYSGYYSLEVPD